MNKPGIHIAFVVDLEVLRELEGLIARAVAAQEDAELRDFIATREAAYARLVDAEPVPVDVSKLVEALGDLRSFESSPHRAAPAVQRLLEAVATTSTHARDVCKAAFERIVTRAGPMRRGVELNAPLAVLELGLDRMTDALLALDGFDFQVRALQREPAKYDDKVLGTPLLMETLRRIYVAGTEECGTHERVGGGPFVMAPEMFPKPRDPASMPGWKRFCTWSEWMCPPRLAVGKQIAAAARRVKQVSDSIEGSRQVSTQVKKDARTYSVRFLRGLARAAEGDHGVVEWVTADKVPC